MLLRPHSLAYSDGISRLQVRAFLSLLAELAERGAPKLEDGAFLFFAELLFFAAVDPRPY
jgi:hypothetical protein